MKNSTDISERIKILADHLNLTLNSFSLQLGYKRSQTIYDYVKGNSNPSYEFFLRLFNSDLGDCVNPIWLITGEGTMENRNVGIEKHPENKVEALNTIIEEQRQIIKALQSERISSLSDSIDGLEEFVINSLSNFSHLDTEAEAIRFRKKLNALRADREKT